MAKTAVTKTAVAETVVEETVLRAPAGRACYCSRTAAAQADRSSVAEDLQGAHTGTH